MLIFIFTAIHMLLWSRGISSKWPFFNINQTKFVSYLKKALYQYLLLFVHMFIYHLLLTETKKCFFKMFWSELLKLSSHDCENIFQTICRLLTYVGHDERLASFLRKRWEVNEWTAVHSHSYGHVWTHREGTILKLNT